MAISNPVVTTVSGTGTSAAINVPASNTGDRLLAWIQFKGGTGIAVTPPSGWTLVDRQNYTNLLGLAVYQRAAGSEPSSYTWTLSASQRWTGGIAAYPGAGPISVQVGRADQYGVRDFATEPITTTSANNRVVAIAAQASPTTWSAPTGWTVQAQQRTGSNVRSEDISSALVDIPQAAAGTVASANLLAAVGASGMLIAEKDNAVRNREASTNVRDALVAMGMSVEILGHSRNDLL